MTDRRVAIRFGTEGKAQVVGDLNDIGTTGDAAYNRVARAAIKAGQDATQAIEAADRSARKLAALMPGLNPTKLDMYAGVQEATRKSAEQSAAVFSAAYSQMEKRAEALRLAIDPVYAAQQRFDREMAEARTLISAGALSLDDYVAKLRSEKMALDAASQAHARGGTSAGAMRMAMAGASFQVQDFVTQISMGANPIQAFVVQGGQLAGQFMFVEGAAGRVARFIMGPWGMALQIGLMAAAMLGGKLLDGANAADTMKEHQQELAKIIDQTTGRINEQSKALLLNQAIMSQRDAKAAQSAADDAKRAIAAGAMPQYKIGGADRVDAAVTNPDARIVAAVRDFQKSGDADRFAARLDAIGKAVPGLRTVTQELLSQSAAYVTASRQVQQYDAQVRLLTGNAKPGDRRLVRGEFGPEKPDLALVDAQAKLEAATTKAQRAEAEATITRIKAKKAYDDGTISIDQYKAEMVKADAAVNAAHEKTDKHAQSLARQAAAMDVSARAAFDVANAYLQSSEAGEMAEARRKAATDATRKGISVDEQAARQMAINAAERVATSAKTVAQLNAEADARDAVRAKLLDGIISTDDMEAALKKEAALRPLIALRTRLQGAELETLNKTIDATSAALDRAAASSAGFNLDKTLAASRDRALELKAALDDLRLSPLDQALNAAQRAGSREADQSQLTDPKDRLALVRSRVGEAQAQYELERGRFISDTVKGQQDSIVLSERELQLVGANDNYREAELAKLRVALDIRRRFPDMAQEDVDKILAGVDAQEKVNAALRRQTAIWDEIKSVGSSALDELFDVKSAETFGERVKNILGDIGNELVKLALLNPIKNWLYGTDNPTIGGVLGKLFGGGSSILPGEYSIPSAGDIFGPSTNPITAFASGTESAPGGLALVGEEGPEIMSVPRGSRVSTAAETRRLLGGANDNASAAPVVNIYADRAVLAEEVRGWVADGIAIASARGAAGGAALAASNAAQRKRRMLA